MKVSQSTILFALLPMAANARLAAPKNDRFLLEEATEVDPVFVEPTDDGEQRKLQTCTDITVNDGQPWYDNRGVGFTCAWYETAEKGAKKNCKKYGRKDKYINFDLIGEEACCACGGGEQPTEPPTEPPTTVTTTTTTTTTTSSNGYNGVCPAQTSAGLALEQEILDLINQNRQAGAVCRGVTMPPVAPLTTVSTGLECVSRYHSKWMSDNSVISHDSNGGAAGDTFVDRFDHAGYTSGAMGEIISMRSTPQSTVNNWMASTTGHCENIMQGIWT